MGIAEKILNGTLPPVTFLRKYYRHGLIVIDEGLSGITNATSAFPIIGVLDVFDCVAGLGWFPNQKTAFAFHVVNPFNIAWQKEQREKEGDRSFLDPLFAALHRVVWEENPEAKAKLSLWGGITDGNKMLCTTQQNLEFIAEEFDKKRGVEITAATIGNNIRKAGINSENGEIYTEFPKTSRGYYPYFDRSWDNTFEIREYWGEGGVMPLHVQFDGTMKEHQLTEQEIKDRSSRRDR
jgi:hypothetical protein